MKWMVLALAVIAACSKSQDAPAAGSAELPPPIPAAEVKRGLDACRAFVTSVCACAEKVPAAKDTCALAATRARGASAS